MHDNRTKIIGIFATVATLVLTIAFNLPASAEDSRKAASGKDFTVGKKGEVHFNIQVRAGAPCSSRECIRSSTLWKAVIWRYLFSNSRRLVIGWIPSRRGNMARSFPINSVVDFTCCGNPTYVFAGMTTIPLSVTTPYSRSLFTS